MTSWAPCEGCDGTGRLVDCRDCDEPTPPTILELNSGFCGQCAADRVMADNCAERARQRRVG